MIIDYNKLSADSYWDFGNIHLDDVNEIKVKGDNDEQ